MGQPIPKKIKEKKPDIGVKPFNTLLVDGSNILRLSMADDTVSSSGKIVGGIFQFLLQLKLILRKGNFRHVYVFWDGHQDYRNRRILYSEYKTNRDLNDDFDEEDLSPYMEEVNARIRSMENYFFKKKDPNKIAAKKKEKEIFFWQREIIMECLEELFIRQCLCDYTEADDFIGYYVAHKKPNERIVIMSNDRDLTQLISDDVIVYVQGIKQFINTKNHTELMGYNYQNVVLKKIICGDTSDNIKGIKGVGETTLLKNFPEIITRKVELEEVVDRARQINESRKENKKKPLQWAQNIEKRVTDGVQGDMIYEINRKIIDLRTPNIMSEEAIETIEGLMYAPLDGEGRSLDNLYQIIVDNDIDKLKDVNIFGNFFTEFMNVVENEKKIWDDE